jgi:Domain of unknown function (DUF5916)
MNYIRSYTFYFAVCVLAGAFVSPAVAGQIRPAFATSPAVGDGARLELPFAYDGPPPPDLPVTVVRDETGRTTVRAVGLTAPLRVDGQLDEALYTAATPISDFIQAEPMAGRPATERTEVWISYDRDYVYVSLRAFESQPDRMIVNEMRRDGGGIGQNESFGFSLDTFYDRRNSVNFNFNAIGGRSDGQNTNEGNWNGDYNPIWDLAVRRSPEGWTAEAAVPFKSLRYRPGSGQIWGIQLKRINRWKNEISYLTRVPDGTGNSGLSRVSAGATLVGIEAPAASRMFDVKPYAIADVTTDATRTVDPSAFGRDVGVDVKYGVTRGLTADFTYNTDFAQVEADEQQVNLTRFSLFFPEKRDFFLENQGVFNFGGANNNGGDTPALFYSRRIGLDGGREIPIEGGARLTGRAGPYSIGVLNIQTAGVDTQGVPATNFAVARVRRDILRRSAIGALATRRSQVSGGTGAGDTVGVDGTFAFFDDLTAQTYWAKTNTPGLVGGDTSYRAQLYYNGDRYGFVAHRLAVGEHFNPDMGYVKRAGFAKYQLNTRFSPRPARIRAVRKFVYQAWWQQFDDTRGGVESRELKGEFKTEFQNSDEFEATYELLYERLDRPFDIATDVTVAAGGYDNTVLRTAFKFGEQRPVSGTAFIERGRLWGGDLTTFGYSGGMVKVNAHLSFEPGLSVNQATLPFGHFTTALITSRVTYTITPLMFVSSLMQYNSSSNSLATNARLRWEYAPGSELFVVYNEGRDTRASGLPDLQNRSIVVKVNRLLRF